MNSFRNFQRTNLIYRIAKAEQMDFVFIGTNGTRLAIQLLTDVAQGKGNQVNSEIVSLLSHFLKLLVNLLIII